MVEIRRTRTVAAEPQAIWDVLADFGAVSAWAGDVDHSCLLTPEDRGIGVGTTRRVQVGRNTLVERITEYEAPRTLAYAVEGYPRWLTVHSRWTLTPATTATVVTLAVTVEVGAGPLSRLAERIVARGSAKWPDAMLAGLAKRMECRNV